MTPGTSQKLQTKTKLLTLSATWDSSFVRHMIRALYVLMYRATHLVTVK